MQRRVDLATQLLGEGQMNKRKLARSSSYGRQAYSYDVVSGYPYRGDQMSTVKIQMLQRYRVDRQAGMAAAGPEQLVILVLKPNTGPEAAYAISKVDAMIIAHKLTDAAHDAKADTQD
jgi:hypothetical protein